MKKLILWLVMFSLFGCAQMQANQQMQPVKAWADDALIKVNKGEMKWSEYYLVFYEKMDKVTAIDDKGFYLEVLNQLIDVSKSYEAGKISKDEFDSVQRKMKALTVQHDEDFAQSARQQSMAIYNDYLQNQAVINQQWKSRKPIYCTSDKLGNSISTICR